MAWREEGGTTERGGREEWQPPEAEGRPRGREAGRDALPDRPGTAGPTPQAPGTGRVLRSDDEIRREIEGSLAVDAGLEGADVRVWVEDGVATLTGTVMSDEDRRRVEDLARSARGVRDVRNRVQTAG